MTPFEEGFIALTDGVRMHYRRYQGGSGTPAVCIPGLTRNERDFEEAAPAFAKTGRDVYVVSLRGRGPSDRDPNILRYHPNYYRDDMLTFLDDRDLSRVILIGTSLGGMTSMLMTQRSPNRIAGVVLNDIGPDLAPEGLARIAGYVGKATENPSAPKTIEEAATRIKAINEVAFPDASDADWIVFARRTFRRAENGSFELDYDPGIARAFAEAGPPPELWTPFASMKETPTLVIRGGISDLLTAPIIDKMREVHTKFDYVEVPRIGHAPMLTEPEAAKAIAKFIVAVD